MKTFNKKLNSYLIFLVGFFISRIGDSLYAFTLPWISYELTGSAIVMGSLFATTVIPTVLFGPFIGVLVDKVKKKRVMLTADILRGIFVAIIPIFYIFHILELWHLYAVSFMLTILSMAFDVSTIAIIPALVKQENLTKANSAYQLVNQTSNIIGPVFAGIVIASIGGYHTLWINVLSFGGTFIAILVMTELNRETINKTEDKFLFSIKESISWLKNDRLNLILSFQAMIGNFGYSLVFAIFIFYLREDMHLSPEQIGINLGLLSIGGLLGSFFAPFIEMFFGKRLAIPLLLSVGTFGFLIAIIQGAWLAPGIGFGIVGFCNIAWSVMVTSIRQESIPKDLLGRVLSFSRMITRLAMPIGALTGGLISDYFSASAVFLLAAFSKLCEVIIAIIFIRPLLPMIHIPKGYFKVKGQG